MMPPSLFEIAIKSVFDDIDNCDKNYVKTVIGPIQQEMLDRMLQMVEIHHLKCDARENHIDKIWAFLPCLIHSKLYTRLDTTDLMRISCKSSKLSNSRFQEFIRCLGSNTPNLRELTIGSLSALHGHSLGERELASIVQLQNLTVLDISGVYFPLSGILDVTRQCKKLEFVYATNVKINMELSSVAFRDDFSYICIDRFRPSLEQFRLRMDKEEEETIQTKCYRIYSMPESVAELRVTELLADKLTKIEISSEYMKDIEKMEEFQHLPELKYAEFTCGYKSAHALRCFMKRNGQSLRELALREIDIEVEMTLGEIFGFCPNLQSLELNCCTLVGNDAPVDAMQQLKRFEWKHLSSKSFDVVAFSSILSAPLLEEININLPIIDLSDNDTIIAQIERRDILRSIKKFEMVQWIYCTSEDEPEISFYARSFDELKNAIVSVISV